VNCREVFDRLGDAIDRQMPNQTRAEFNRHLDACPPCRANYELERMCKHIVSHKLMMVHTPSAVQNQVHTLLRNEDADKPSWIDRLLGNKFLTPILVTGLAVVAVFLFLSKPQQVPDEGFSRPAAADIVQQSVDNFSLILAGSLKPTMTACSPDSVLSFLQAGDIPFSAKVLRLKDCQSYSAIINEVNGARLAHVVYAVGPAGLLYVYEAEKEEAWKGTSLTLTSEAKQSLEQTGWYFTTDQQQRNVVLHALNGTLMAAVSSMPRDTMVALLTSY